MTRGRHEGNRRTARCVCRPAIRCVRTLPTSCCGEHKVDEVRRATARSRTIVWPVATVARRGWPAGERGRTLASRRYAAGHQRVLQPPHRRGDATWPRDCSAGRGFNDELVQVATPARVEYRINGHLWRIPDGGSSLHLAHARATSQGRRSTRCTLEHHSSAATTPAGSRCPATGPRQTDRQRPGAISLRLTTAHLGRRSCHRDQTRVSITSAARARLGIRGSAAGRHDSTTHRRMGAPARQISSTAVATTREGRIHSGDDAGAEPVRILTRARREKLSPRPSRLRSTSGRAAAVVTGAVEAAEAWTCSAARARPRECQRSKSARASTSGGITARLNSSSARSRNWQCRARDWKGH